MPSPLQGLLGITIAFSLLLLFLALLGSIRGRAPDGLENDGSPVTSVSGVWEAFAFVALAGLLLMIRHWLAWLALMVAFSVVLLTSTFDVAGTVRQMAIIVILALPGTRAYYGVGRSNE